MWRQLLSDAQTQLQQHPAAMLAKAIGLILALIAAVTGVASLLQKRRQHRAAIKPDVTARIDEFLKPNVGPYHAVAIHNAGPGPAQNVHVDLRARTKKRIGHSAQSEVPIVRDIASLAVDQLFRLAP